MKDARPWWQAQLIVGAVALLLAVAVYAVSRLGWSTGAVSPGISAYILGGYIFPGIALSLAVNGTLLALRRPRLVTVAERWLLLVEASILLACVLFASMETFGTSFSFLPGVDALQYAFALSLGAWPVLIVLAITITIVLTVNSVRLRKARLEP